MERFFGRTALITGGGGEVAKAAGIRILKEGGNVVLTDLTNDSLSNARREIAQQVEDGRLRTVPGDIRKLTDCEAAVHEAIQAFGKLDIVIAAAGILRHRPIDQLSEQNWQDVIDINLTGAYHTLRAAVPHMKKRQYGRIVLISSVGGRTGRPGVGVNYAAAKAGMIGMAQLLGYELGPWNITVNAVAPGPLRGRMLESLPEESIRRLVEPIRLGRLGEMEEIAAGIAYLASEEAGWTTGEVLDINGGIQY